MIELNNREVTCIINANMKLVYVFTNSNFVELTFIFDGFITKNLGKIPLSKALESILKFNNKEVNNLT